MRLFFLFLIIVWCGPLIAGIPKDINGLSPIDKQPRKILLNGNETATVVVFLSASCPCSDSHIPYLKKIKLEFPQITFIAIHSNMDEDEKTTEAYFKAVNLPFDVIQDVEARLADQFQAYKTPHAFIISKEGKVLYEGGVTSSAKAHQASHFYLRDALTDLTSGRPIKTKEVRTLGCMIAREKDA
jgi:hypothetical protein